MRIGTNKRVFNERLTAKIYQRLVDDVASIARLKIADLASFAEVLGTFVSDQPKPNEIILGQRILNEVCDNWVQFMCYPSVHNFVGAIISNLLQRGIHNTELIDNFLRPDYQTLINNKNKVLNRAVYEINGYAKINLKGIYTGNTLSESYIKIMGKFCTEYAPNDGKQKKRNDFIISIKNTVEQLYKYFRYANAVSHFKDAGK